MTLPEIITIFGTTLPVIAYVCLCIDRKYNMAVTFIVTTILSFIGYGCIFMVDADKLYFFPLYVIFSTSEMLICVVISKILGIDSAYKVTISVFLVFMITNILSQVMVSIIKCEDASVQKVNGEPITLNAAINFMLLYLVSGTIAALLLRLFKKKMNKLHTNVYRVTGGLILGFMIFTILFKYNFRDEDLNSGNIHWNPSFILYELFCVAFFAAIIIIFNVVDKKNMQNSYKYLPEDIYFEYINRDLGKGMTLSKKLSIDA
ncbi:MAG: hypothetical protein K6G11_07195, partial [Lachnospiraceae bacterium]|nr:hypothetical protein [Lachnospiraceae bacterium]